MSQWNQLNRNSLLHLYDFRFSQRLWTVLSLVPVVRRKSTDDPEEYTASIFRVWEWVEPDNSMKAGGGQRVNAFLCSTNIQKNIRNSLAPPRPKKIHKDNLGHVNDSPKITVTIWREGIDFRRRSDMLPDLFATRITTIYSHNKASTIITCKAHLIFTLHFRRLRPLAIF
jgi:hypothetical protein